MDDAPSACRPSEGGGFEEVAVIPIYWFALDRHFQTVRTLPEAPEVRRERRPAPDRPASVRPAHSS